MRIKNRISVLILLLAIACYAMVPVNATSASITFGDFQTIEAKGFQWDLMRSLGQLAVVDIYDDNYSLVSQNGFDSIIPFKEGKNKLLNGEAVEGCIAMKVVQNKGTLILITFQGTNTKEKLDWILDVSAIGDIQGIHSGFSMSSDMFLGKYGDGLQNLYTTAEKRNEDCQFIITGHSLGGAIAQIVTYRLNTEYGIPKDHMLTYTYGSPMPFNRFQNYGTWPNIYNLQNTEDIVVNLLIIPNKNIGSNSTFTDNRGLDLKKEHVDGYIQFLDLDPSGTAAQASASQESPVSVSSSDDIHSAPASKKTQADENLFLSLLQMNKQDAVKYLEEQFPGGHLFLFDESIGNIPSNMTLYSCTELDFELILCHPSGEDTKATSISCGDQVNVSGVNRKMTYDEIRSVLGEPYSVKESWDMYTDLDCTVATFSVDGLRLTFRFLSMLDPPYNFSISLESY